MLKFLFLSTHYIHLPSTFCLSVIANCRMLLFTWLRLFSFVVYIGSLTYQSGILRKQLVSQTELIIR